MSQMLYHLLIEASLFFVSFRYKECLTTHLFFNFHQYVKRSFHNCGIVQKNVLGLLQTSEQQHFKSVTRKNTLLHNWKDVKVGMRKKCIY
jgi:hypothetical protein